MAKKESTALATIGGDEYAIMKANPSEVAAIIRENVGDGGVSAFDLDRITMPSGRTGVFGIPTLDGDEAVKDFTGVVVYWHDVRAYWAHAYGQGGSNTPDCSSSDCKTGHGEPGGPCAECHLNEFGTATKDDGTAGSGKACSERKRLFIMLPDRLLPVVLSAPPTSLRTIRQFLLRLGGQGVPYYGVALKFGLEKDQSDDGADYHKLTLSVVERLTGEQTDAMRSLREFLQPQMASIPVTADDAPGQ